MTEDITELIGKDDGPTSIILAGVHGNERCGVDAFEKILSGLQINNGRVFFIYGNPRALALNKRQDEANLNRMFKYDENLSITEKNSYEYTRAQFLKKYLDQSGALLDIHASYTKNSVPFIICEPNAEEIVKYLPSNLIVSGFDDVEPGGTDYYMNRIGKIGICIECGYLGDDKSKEIAEKSIFAFLKARGHLVNDVLPNEKLYIKIYDLYKTKTNEFTLSKPFEDFESLSGGQIIGKDGDSEIRVKKDSVILFARNLEIPDAEAFLLGEKKNSLV